MILTMIGLLNLININFKILKYCNLNKRKSNWIIIVFL